MGGSHENTVFVHMHIIAHKIIFFWKDLISLYKFRRSLYVVKDIKAGIYSDPRKRADDPPGVGVAARASGPDAGDARQAGREAGDGR